MTIVSGLPRSGTSLAMQMLDAAGHPILSDGVRKADDDNPRGYFEYEKVKSLRRDASWLQEARGRALKVVAPLLPALPPELEFRVLWMERDLDEVLASQTRMLERSGAAGDGDTASLRTAFERTLAKVRAELARRNVLVLEIEHAALLADPAPHAEALCRFVGGNLDPGAAAAVVDPSLHRQRRAKSTAETER